MIQRLPRITILILIIAASLYAQLPQDIVAGPGLDYGYSSRFQFLRLNTQILIPGEFMDIESDVLSLSVILDQAYLEEIGIAWTSLLALPPYFLSKKFKFMRRPALALLGLNSIANGGIFFGNKWIRAGGGWKNDIFIFREIAWFCYPFAGCKIALPEKIISNTAFSATVSFPFILSSLEDLRNRPFVPLFFFGLDFYLIAAEIAVEAP
ncbi:MAG: hypothetical protein GF401_20740 [Chitinivibrionales bacterium]|nr:hypothetical protein [Chitinivibrionales bacterium]